MDIFHVFYTNVLQNQWKMEGIAAFTNFLQKKNSKLLDSKLRIMWAACIILFEKEKKPLAAF